MAAQSKRPRETTGAGEKRRNPRFPNSRVWTEEERLRHRQERDSTIEQAGLVTDRQLDSDATGGKGET